MKRFLLLIFLYAGVYSQDTLTIMTYNVLHFSGNTTGRVQSIKKVMDYAQPDIVIFQELEHQSGIDLLLSDVFNVDSTAFAAGTLPSSSYMKTGIIYRKSKLDLSSHVVLSTVLRSIPGYTLSIKNAHSNVKPFTIFGAHLKASDGTSESEQRWEEAKELYKHVAQKDQNYHYIFGGDFNLYDTEEPAYKLLTDSMTVDLEDVVGHWVRKESAHVMKYTQSTRTESIGDGGSTGGLDDRFDFILFSDHFTSSDPDLKYVDGSYTVIGNDGNHYDKALIDGGNSAVPDSIAEAIYFASDHYPVVAKIAYTTKSSTSPIAHAGGDVVAAIGDTVYLDGSQSYDPNGTIIYYVWDQTSGPAVTLNMGGSVKANFVVPDVNRTTSFTFKLTVSDNDGEGATDFVNVVVPVVGGYTPYDIQFTENQGVGENCYPSEFEGQNVEVTGVVTAVRPDQEYPNFFFQDPTRTEWAGMFVYIDKGYTPPNIGDQVKLKGDISEYFGMTEMKNIVSTEILSSGVSVEPVTVTASSVSGDCRVWVEKYEGMLVRIVNVEVTQSANKDGQWFASDYTGTAMIDGYMFDGDWPLPEYGTHFISITGVLHYSYGKYKLMPRNGDDFNDPVTAVGDELPERFELLTNYPNPFNPTTTIEFGVVNNGENHGYMSLQIIDINGRVVATLVNGIPNSNKVVWNGKNDGGQPMPAGIYFARMESGKRVLTQKMVLLK